MFGIAILFTGFFILLVVFYLGVLTYNYLASKAAKVKPPLFPGEQVENEVTIPHWTARDFMVVTNYRIVESCVRWLFSWKSDRISDLNTCDSFSSWHFLNPLFLILSFFLIPVVAPLGYSLYLFACVSFITYLTYSLKFGGRHVVHKVTASRRAAGQLRRFSLDVERLRRNTKHNLAYRDYPDLENSYLPSYDIHKEFGFHPYFKFTIAFCMFISLLQRFYLKHVGMDDLALFPLLLAAPAVAGAFMPLGQALLTGFFGFWAIFTIAYPSSSPLAWNYPGAGADVFIHYFGIALTLGLVGALAAYLAGLNRTEYAGAAIFLWVLFVALQEPANILDLSFVAKLLLAFLYASIGIWMVRSHKDSLAEPHPVG